MMRWVLAVADRQLYAAIRARREQGPAAAEGRTDVLSLLLNARVDEPDDPGAAHSGEAGCRAGGRPRRGLTDHEIRDELMSLVLAGHETTANSLAWTFERLVRTPAAYDRLRELVRAGDPGAAATEYIEATIHEGMRVRPVIPGDRADDEAAMAPRRVRGARRDSGRGQHRRAAPPPRRVSRAARVHARAVRRQQARDVHVDPVRRRDPALPRRVAGNGRAAGRDRGDRPAHGPGGDQVTTRARHGSGT